MRKGLTIVTGMTTVRRMDELQDKSEPWGKASGKGRRG
jgi:hypothetical protein